MTRQEKIGILKALSMGASVDDLKLPQINIALLPIPILRPDNFFAVSTSPAAAIVTDRTVYKNNVEEYSKKVKELLPDYKVTFRIVTEDEYDSINAKLEEQY